MPVLPAPRACERSVVPVLRRAARQRFRASPAPRLLSARLGRAALYALSTAGIAFTVDCGSTSSKYGTPPCFDGCGELDSGVHLFDSGQVQPTDSGQLVDSMGGDAADSGGAIADAADSGAVGDGAQSDATDAARDGSQSDSMGSAPVYGGPPGDV
jgi:hypothetical protein